MNTGTKTLISIDGGKCPSCGGKLEFVRCDRHAIYFECSGDGHRERYTFQSRDEADGYIASAKSEMLGRVRDGINDWQAINWERLQKDLVDFINRFAPLEHDIELQIARIACITSGFNLIDDQKYKSCKIRFKITDKIYKSELKRLKKLSKTPVLSETMEGYQDLREKYIKLRNRYLETKFIWKIFFSAVKLLKKVIFPA